MVLGKSQTIVTDERCFVDVEIRWRVILPQLTALDTMEHNRKAFLWQQIRLEQQTRNLSACASAHDVFVQISIRPRENRAMGATIQLEVDDPVCFRLRITTVSQPSSARDKTAHVCPVRESSP